MFKDDDQDMNQNNGDDMGPTEADMSTENTDEEEKEEDEDGSSDESA